MPFKLALSVGTTIVFIIFSISEVFGATDNDFAISDDTAKNFINDLSKSSTELVWENLKRQYEEFDISDESKSDMPKTNGLPRNFSGLYVFISTSMPKQVLKNYYIEATKYGGTLVFKGLPQGTFNELAKVVLELTGNDMADNRKDLGAGSIQIDDEAFERFSVKAVPTVVLVKEEPYHPTQTSVAVYDKIVGNIGIRLALEKFAAEGQLKSEAESYLNASR